MSEMASWFKTKTGYIFLTDADVIAWHENQGESVRDINWYDFVGHYGIMKVFSVPDQYSHIEGFTDMPDVIKKCILEGKCDRLFAHAGNLREATPEFIPMMRRLANKYPNVRKQLRENPYAKNKNKKPETLFDKMKDGCDSGFDDMTIGQIIRHPSCTPDIMIYALDEGYDIMDSHSDKHHYRQMIAHPNINKTVLDHIIRYNKGGSEVSDLAIVKLNSFKKRKLTPRRARRAKKLSQMRIKTIRRGKAKIRAIA